MSKLDIGSRVRLNVKKSSRWEREFYEGKEGVVEDLTANPWFPVLVLIDDKERPTYFRADECEPIEEGNDV